MDKENRFEVPKLTPEEQEKLDKAQMVCDTLVSEMETRIMDNKNYGMSSSTLIEIVDGSDSETADVVQRAMMMTKGYFRYFGNQARVDCISRHPQDGEHTLEFELTVLHKLDEVDITPEEE